MFFLYTYVGTCSRLRLFGFSLPSRNVWTRILPVSLVSVRSVVIGSGRRRVKVYRVIRNKAFFILNRSRCRRWYGLDVGFPLLFSLSQIVGNWKRYTMVCKKIGGVRVKNWCFWIRKTRNRWIGFRLFYYPFEIERCRMDWRFGCCFLEFVETLVCILSARFFRWYGIRWWGEGGLMLSDFIFLFEFDFNGLLDRKNRKFELRHDRLFGIINYLKKKKHFCSWKKWTIFVLKKNERC